MSAKAQRLTKRQQRLSEKKVIRFPSTQQLHFDLKHIEPITDNQNNTFRAYDNGDNLFLHGCAGTGKTFISLYLALKEIEEGRSRRNKLIIIRTAQASKDIGYLPGSEKQKLEVYEAPYRAICAELYNRGDAYDVLKQKGIIEFQGTSFLRGTTLDNAIILIDEVQNMRQQEWFTVLTRTGDQSRVILCGDTKQDDLTSQRYKEKSGIVDLIRVFEAMETASLIHFDVNDIVRSGFVRDLVLTAYRLGI
jgi:phosphate starvation-inducible protein PhoH